MSSAMKEVRSAHKQVRRLIVLYTTKKPDCMTIDGTSVVAGQPGHPLISSIAREERLELTLSLFMAC